MVFFSYEYLKSKFGSLNRDFSSFYVYLLAKIWSEPTILSSDKFCLYINYYEESSPSGSVLFWYLLPHSKMWALVAPMVTVCQRCIDIDVQRVK
jgi:hypothetical protein